MEGVSIKTRHTPPHVLICAPMCHVYPCASHLRFIWLALGLYSRRGDCAITSRASRYWWWLICRSRRFWRTPMWLEGWWSGRSSFRSSTSSMNPGIDQRASLRRFRGRVVLRGGTKRRGWLSLGTLCWWVVQPAGQRGWVHLGRTQRSVDRAVIEVRFQSKQQPSRIWGFDRWNLAG